MPMSIARSHHPALLLTSQWQGDNHSTLLSFWWRAQQGAICQQIEQPSVCFIEQADQDKAQAMAHTLGWPLQFRVLELKHFNGAPAVACYLPEKLLPRWRQVLAEQGIVCREADINPTRRYLMERFIYGQALLSGEFLQQPTYQSLKGGRMQAAQVDVPLRLLSLDIETSMPRLNQSDQLFSIGLYGEHLQRVLMLGAGGATELIEYHADEPSLLKAFLQQVQQYDPDVLIGWHVVGFDMDFLQRKFTQHGIDFALGRDGSKVQWRQFGNGSGEVELSMAGRVVLDGIRLLRQAGFHFDSFALDFVAAELLQDGKLLHGAERGADIERLFQQDKAQLAAYNLKDCELVWRIFAQSKLLDFAIERSRMTGLALDRMGGSIAAFENLYLPKLHRAGYVAPNMDEGFFMENSPGGYVLDSTPGLFKHVLVLDFKSLYPSIMRTFCIDPMGLVEGLNANKNETVEGFMGARFHRTRHLLPALLTELGAKRDAAKAAGNQPLSQAIKVIMASCYGVLGAQGCRFADNRLTASITLRGHEIIQRSCQWVKLQGHEVIYGDTDSIFVWLNQELSDEQADAIGQQLMHGLNQWWQQQCQSRFGLTSYLEIQYETHYRHFFMPAIRGSEEGSKKRYAGLVYKQDEPRLVVKGMEAARSDWTPLAKAFQTELYQRVFLRQPYQHWLLELVKGLLAGELDSQLHYRKRLRQPLTAYQKNIPPHAQAALKLEQWRHSQELPPLFNERGGFVCYLWTATGPEPVIEGQPLPVPDYSHYLEKQLRPIAEAIFQFTGDDFDALAGLQLRLF